MIYNYNLLHFYTNKALLFIGIYFIMTRLQNYEISFIFIALIIIHI